MRQSEIYVSLRSRNSDRLYDFWPNRSFDFIERIIQADITMWRLGHRLIMGNTPLQSMASQVRQFVDNDGCAQCLNSR